MISFKISKKEFNFVFPAGTSRGVLNTKTSFFIEFYFNNKREIKGVGEVSVIKGLSIDFVSDEDHINKIDFFCQQIKSFDLEKLNSNQVLNKISKIENIKLYPSILFGIETAILDLINGGNKCYFDNDFYNMKSKIPINGLIWMGNEEFMWKQIEDKIKLSFSCIKLKIGGIDFNKECEILSKIRTKFDKSIIIRLDANGAFDVKFVYEKLKILSEFNIHSIEQPIKTGQIDEMYEICSKSPIPIALDEELIGIYNKDLKENLLKRIKPKYIVLKPSLHGGICGTKEWIEIAENMRISWWITSALESNIGLNAICQFTSEYSIKLHQGLGTGKIYTNNMESFLKIENGKIFRKYEV